MEVNNASSVQRVSCEESEHRHAVDRKGTATKPAVLQLFHQINHPRGALI